MPLIYHKNIENGEIGLWKVTEDLEDLKQSAGLSSDDLQIYSGISPLHRKKEWLATRSLLNQLIGKPVQVKYHNDGRPFLDNIEFNISISHTTGFVAVILNKTCNPGIDIELSSRQVGKVARRYLSPEEYEYCHGLAENSNRKCLIHWCAKEAVYKMIPFSNIEFSTDILITLQNTTQDSGSFMGVFTKDSLNIRIELEYLEKNDIILVWGCTKEII